MSIFTTHDRAHTIDDMCSSFYTVRDDRVALFLHLFPPAPSSSIAASRPIRRLHASSIIVYDALFVLCALEKSTVHAPPSFAFQRTTTPPRV
jgi:hypothetical protein